MKPAHWMVIRCGNFRLAGALAALWIVSATCSPALASTGPGDDICGLVPGLQGRIGDVTSDPGVAATAYVERAGQTHPVASGCFVREGDIVRVGPGTKATVMLPNHQVATATFDAPLPVPSVKPGGYFTEILGVLRSVAGDDGSQAREVATAKIAATRSLRPPFFLLGVADAEEQLIDVGNPLYLRWEGGAPPFAVALLPASGGAPVTISGIAERTARIDAQKFAAGIYQLTIASSGQTVPPIQLRVVAHSEVPTDPDAANIKDDEARELVNAVWLLTRGPEPWRLEALSRLKFLAAERDDIVAQDIVAASPEKP